MEHMFSQQSGLEENVCRMTRSSSYSLQNCMIFFFFFHKVLNIAFFFESGVGWLLPTQE